MNTYEWYTQLKKPFFAPPSSLFGPVWSGLYLIIFSSFGYVFYLAIKKLIPYSVALPFVLNLVFNFAFTPLQFGLRNNYLALADIIIVLVSLVWCIYYIYPYSKAIAVAQIPYLLWVSFATILQVSITYLNR